MRSRRSPPDQRTAPASDAVARRAAALGVSITNERGESFRYQAHAVSLRVKHGVVQIVEREHGCFVWFKRCRLEVRDGRRNILFRLLAGSASSDGNELTIVAEVARRTSGSAAVA